MRLVCPSCAATYDVARDILPQSGQVRCARCGTEWQIERQAPAPREPDPEPPDMVRPAPVWPEVLAPAPLPVGPASVGPALKRNRNVAAAWALSALVLVVLAAAVLVFHDDIQRTWPPSARLFSLFGW